MRLGAEPATVGGRSLDRPDTGETPDIRRGATRSIETPLGAVLVTVDEEAPGQPAEVFVRAGKAGSDLAGFAEAIGRLCSLCLRLPPETPAVARLKLIADELAGIGGARGAWAAGAAASLPDAVARALADAAGAGAIRDDESPRDHVAG